MTAALFRRQIVPALKLDFTGATLPSLSFIRSSTATYVGSTGLIQTAAAGVPRQDWDPLTLTCKGLLIERQASNLITSSNAAPTGNYNSVGTPGATTGPDGVAGSAWVFPSSQTGFMQSNYSVSGLPSVCTFSIYAKQTGLGARVYLGLTQVTTAYVAVGGYYDFASDSFVNCPAGCYSVPHANGWRRLVYPVSGVTSGASSFVWRLDADGTYGGDMRGIAFWGAQLEAGADATSIIPTSGSAQTRSGEICWRQQDSLSPFAAGAVVMSFRRGGPAYSGTEPLFSLMTLANVSSLFVSLDSGGRHLTGPYIPAAVAAGTGPADMAAHKLAVAWDCAGGTGASCLDGGAIVAGTQAAVTPGTPNVITIGTNYGWSSQSGHLLVSSLMIYSRRLPGAVLQKMTR